MPDSDMKKYWAAYMNLARLNFFKTLMFISDAIGDLRPLRDEHQEGNTEGNMHNMGILTMELLPEDEVRARALLLKHFPFLRACNSQDGLSLRTIRRILIDMACTLGRYRNEYSHSRCIVNDEKTLSSEERCAKDLQLIMIVSTRVIKERYSSNRNSVQKGMLDEQSLKFITDGRIIGDKRTFDKSYYLSTIDKDSKHLSYFGKLLLTTILLNKKYAMEFLTQCHFLDAFKDSDIGLKLSERRLMFEVMTVLRIRLAERKLSNEKSDVLIALDMLNELKKCPSELFELLGDEDRRKFSVKSDIGDIVLLRRNQDRFAQLALSWLDSSNAFEKLRFQVNAGKFRYLFREKKFCVDGQIRMRVLEEPLNAYRRIMEFENDRLLKQSDGNNNLWSDIKILNQEESPRNDKTILPYITDSRVRYLFDGDNIGISMGDFTPSITKTLDGQYKVEGKVADCYLSKYELVGLLFYHLLVLEHANGAESVKSAERIIVDTIRNYRRLFSDIMKGLLKPRKDENYNQLDGRLQCSYSIKLADVPDKIRDYLLNQGSPISDKYHRWKKYIINEMIENTEARKSKIDADEKKVKSADNKPGKANYVFLKPGAYSSYIAYDIVRFQECKSTEKLTGLNFKVIQSRMATFKENGGTSFEVLLQTFIKAKLVTETLGKGSHPFLYKVLNRHPSNIVKLYKCYLEEKCLYLRGDIHDDACFLHAERKKWNNRDEQYYRELAGRYLSRPVQLPRQLFELPIQQLLLSNYGVHADELKTSINEAVSRNRCNTTYMILEYFANYLYDGPQYFYGLSEGDAQHDYNYRFYSLIRNNIQKAKIMLKELGKDRLSKGTLFYASLKRGVAWAEDNPVIKQVVGGEDFACIIRKSYKDMTETEKKLRRYAVQDEVLFLAAKMTINKTLGCYNNDDFLLCDIKPQGNGILGQTIPWIRTRHFINTGSKRQPPKEVSILQENVKLKDFGKMFKVLNDRRVYDLLYRYKSNEEVRMKDLSEELDRYDSHRVDVFDLVLKYENKITKGYSDAELMDGNSYVDFKTVQRFDRQNSPGDKFELRRIRNAFSHNQYPQSDYEPVDYDTSMPEIADKIVDIAKHIEEKTR